MLARLIGRRTRILAVLARMNGVNELSEIEVDGSETDRMDSPLGVVVAGGETDRLDALSEVQELGGTGEADGRGDLSEDLKAVLLARCSWSGTLVIMVRLIEWKPV